MFPEAVNKVGGMVVDLHFKEEPHQLSQHDLAVGRLLAPWRELVCYKVTVVMKDSCSKFDAAHIFTCRHY